MGMEELKWRQLAHRQLMSLQAPHFSPLFKVIVDLKFDAL